MQFFKFKSFLLFSQDFPDLASLCSAIKVYFDLGSLYFNFFDIYMQVNTLEYINPAKTI